MIRLNELLKTMSISKPTIYKWIKAGCPVHYVGKIPYFDMEEVNLWIKSLEKGE